MKHFSNESMQVSFTRRLALVLLTALLEIGTLGASARKHIVPEPLNLAALHQAELGRIAVRPGSEPAQVFFQAGTRQRMSASEVADERLEYILFDPEAFSGNLILSMPFRLAVLPFAIADAPRAARADRIPEHRLRGIEEHAARALAELAEPRRCYDSFMKEAGQRCERTFIGGSAPAGVRGSHGAESLLEVVPEQIRFAPIAGSGNSFVLSVTVRVRLTRTRDDAVLYDAPFTFQSDECHFTDWTLNRGEPLQQVGDTALRTLSREILDRVFGLPRFDLVAANQGKRRPSAASGARSQISATSAASVSGVSALPVPRVALISTSAVPGLLYRQPMTRGEGGDTVAGFWSGRGDEEARTRALFLDGDPVLSIGLAVLPVIVAADLAGSAVGSFQGISAEKIRVGRAAIREASPPAGFHELLRASAHHAIQSIRPGLVRLIDPPAAPHLPASIRNQGTLAALAPGQSELQHLRETGCEFAIEIRLERMALTGSGEVNPRLALHMETRVLWLRLSDGAVLDGFELRYAGKARSFTAWTDADASALRTELARCQSLAAAEIASRIQPWLEPGPPAVQIAESKRVQNNARTPVAWTSIAKP